MAAERFETRDGCPHPGRRYPRFRVPVSRWAHRSATRGRGPLHPALPVDAHRRLPGAGAADGKYHHQPKRRGPVGQALVATAYSEGERRILDQASKAFGWEANHTAITPDGSKEVDDVHRVSPVRVRKKK